MAKTVFITGASRGIGRATALAFASAGYGVAAGYLHAEEDIQSLMGGFAQSGVMAVAVRGDVADPQAVEHMIASVHTSLGGIDVLINNAGVAHTALLSETGTESWQRLMDVNLTGVYHCCRGALPDLIARNGVILNVSSVWGVLGGSCEAAYSAAKAGVIGLTKALAKELGPMGVRVNCVAPGVIDTDMLSNLSLEDKAELACRTPLGRLGAPEDVANALLFLASPQASFLTGQVLGVDGGFFG